MNNILDEKKRKNNNTGILPDYVTKPEGVTIPSSSSAGEVSSSSSSSGDAGSSDGGCGLAEAKRYVRRYFIRPQNVFCSNKEEVLEAIIKYDDQDMTIYTLNNLEDNNDTTKLTNKDVIYYYEDGILYDKNYIKILPELEIKHEEDRPKINVDTSSDATFKDAYYDRLTNVDLDEMLNEWFKPYLNESVERVCCICGEPLEGEGNNPEPYVPASQGKCCDACNMHFVIPSRLENED